MGRIVVPEDFSPRSVSMALLCASLAAGVMAACCAKPVPEPVPHPPTPHISWSITVGQSDDEVCKSTEKSPCVVPATRNDKRPQTATFHVFLHPAAGESKYQGQVVVGFIAGADPKGDILEVGQTVKPDGAPVNVSATGVVKMPGLYDVDIALTASAPNTNPTPIKERVRVTVK
jgi:hypothetical protein